VEASIVVLPEAARLVALVPMVVRLAGDCMLALGDIVAGRVLYCLELLLKVGQQVAHLHYLPEQVFQGLYRSWDRSVHFVAMALHRLYSS
jgi:hypothetical protein